MQASVFELTAFTWLEVWYRLAFPFGGRTNMKFVGPRQWLLPRPEARGLPECFKGFVRAHAGGLQQVGGRRADSNR